MPATKPHLRPSDAAGEPRDAGRGASGMLRRHAPRLESASMALMLFGILALCQPWNEFLHRYSVLMIIVGLVAFNVFSRIGPSAGADAEDARDEAGTLP